jgi:hypothetical protein
MTHACAAAVPDAMTDSFAQIVVAVALGAEHLVVPAPVPTDRQNADAAAEATTRHAGCHVAAAPHAAWNAGRRVRVVHVADETATPFVSVVTPAPVLGGRRQRNAEQQRKRECRSL